MSLLALVCLTVESMFMKNSLKKFLPVAVTNFLGKVKMKLRREIYRAKIAAYDAYLNPSDQELISIERDFREMDIELHDLHLSPKDFFQFRSSFVFPEGYHGGKDSPVYDEKLLEHCIAYSLLELNKYSPEDIYVDVAASTSPWAKLLRESFHVRSFAIDLNPVPPCFSDLSYYLQEDATRTSFESESVRGASLQCAFEMFLGDSDGDLLREFSRILVPGGKLIISPLYMHTHFCAYSSPDYVGKGYADPGAKEYVERVYGVFLLRESDTFLISKSHT